VARRRRLITSADIESAPERAPTDPTLDPVPDEPVDVPLETLIVDIGVQTAETVDAAAIDAIAYAKAPVQVRNRGSRAWGGSDYAAVGPGSVPAGGVGVVTRRKAEDLLAGRYAGAGLGVGPFEIVEE